jgi:hypothetical protein
MKKKIIIAVAAIALLTTSVTIHRHNHPTTTPVATRPMRLVIIGPEGQPFTGSYVADGVTNTVSALAPAAITLQARNVDFEFKREGGTAEFRVALYVGDLCRTSTTSDKKPGVRGALHYSAEKESYWASSVD